jgi:hypothetical protein
VGGLMTGLANEMFGSWRWTTPTLNRCGMRLARFEFDRGGFRSLNSVPKCNKYDGEHINHLDWHCLFQALVFGSFCSFIASEKNRDFAVWFFLGFLFSFIALFALIAVPKLDLPVELPHQLLPLSPSRVPTPTKTKVFRWFLIIFGIGLVLIIVELTQR